LFKLLPINDDNVKLTTVEEFVVFKFPAALKYFCHSTIVALAVVEVSLFLISLPSAVPLADGAVLCIKNPSTAYWVCAAFA
jgi:hypothetical protein